MNPDGIIARRLVTALSGSSLVALGPGLPQRVQAVLPGSLDVLNLNGHIDDSPVVEIAVVEALEVGSQGDLAVAHQIDLEGLRAGRWIVVMHHTHDDGQAKMVKQVRQPVSRTACVNEVITELGLIGIESVGFVLREVAPGVSSDDVRKGVAASLHVADDLKVME